MAPTPSTSASAPAAPPDVADPSDIAPSPLDEPAQPTVDSQGDVGEGPSATLEPSPSDTPTVPSATPSDEVVPSPASPSPAGADVELSYLAWNAGPSDVEASGYAAVYEEGGTCTLVLTKGGTTVSAAVDGTSDVTTTSCGGLAIPHDQLSSGTWQAVLRYESPTTTGTSKPREVVVP
ncbi:hypothetical protein [Puerhibacterium puerhi]|uniref:hypothetical protein n=1 Tax=Puerhibacterium puerhi TaxID=2692623 RepID=UPI00135B5AC6|nr:hypothetical protein [Puerhibacterium puerhi]